MADLYFNGVDTTVFIPNISAYDPGGSLTISGDILDELPDSSTHVLNKDDYTGLYGTAIREWIVRYETTDTGNYHCWFHVSDSIDGDYDVLVQNTDNQGGGSPTWYDNSLFHFDMVCYVSDDGVYYYGNVDVYINGGYVSTAQGQLDLIATANATPVPTYGTSPIYLGQVSGYPPGSAGAAHFTGYLYNVYVQNSQGIFIMSDWSGTNSVMPDTSANMNNGTIYPAVVPPSFNSFIFSSD